ncbi:hypothetical protein [Levilactobacillus zymae]|uniref:hypothetical protein n=1 Tax=Levilactobacillus zymae TaxID=267363 RepID=UPI0028BB8625|nr:hypothetical protein [Levilactobacillus zymae]MDT6981397.1 hypothetical protein [Levilactobacillus zymae]
MQSTTWLPWLTATAAVLFAIGGSGTTAAAKTYTQHGNALANYNVAKYRTVNNRNLSVKRYSFTGQGSTLTSIRGKRVGFKTNLLLPDQTGWQNPQSLVMTKTGSTMYVLSTQHNDRGFIAKYNLTALRKLGATSGALALAFKDQRQHTLTARDKAIIKNVKVGPEFACGHGQSLARNPKNGQLWFVGATAIHSNVQQVSTKTLKPVKRINFTLKSTVPMGENLTFDKHGNAYFYTYSNGGWAPKGSVKIYQGKIHSKSVRFHLIMQGLRHNPGTKSQSLAYNAQRNRLYFISDGSISSIPVSKLGHLKAKDVEATNLNGHREFEGLQFTSNGAGYLLTNRPAQVMRTTKNF